MAKKLWSKIIMVSILAGTMLVNLTASLPSAASEPDSYHDDWLHVNENAEIVKSRLDYRLQLVRIQCRKSDF
jgi:hypothetical protein